jgi:uncharacterized membrane protein YdfJ with MMPL/SSD domain
VTSAFFEGLAGFVVRFRVLVVAAWAVVMVAAMLALPGLGSKANSDPGLFLSSGAKSVKASSLGSPLLGSSAKSKITIVAARADGPLTAADLAAVGREARLAQQVSGVTSAKRGKKSISSAGAGAISGSGAVAISPDGKAVQFDVNVNASSKDVAVIKPVVNALQATFSRPLELVAVAAGPSRRSAGDPRGAGPGLPGVTVGR